MSSSNNKNKNQNKNNKRSLLSNITWIYVIIAVAILWFLMTGDNTILSGTFSRNITYSQFKNYVEQGYASKIVANKDEGTVQMFVKPEHIRDVFNAGSDQVGSNPYVEAEYGSADKLEEFVTAQQEQGDVTGEVS